MIAVWMIHLRGSQPPSNAIKQQDFAAELLILVGIVVAVTLLAHAVQVAQGGSARPSDRS